MPVITDILHRIYIYYTKIVTKKQAWKAGWDTKKQVYNTENCTKKQNV